MSKTKSEPTLTENPSSVDEGQMWRDNDPRRGDAIFTVDKVFQRKGRWYARGVRSETGNVSTILLSRMDGKKYSRVTGLGGGDYSKTVTTE